MKILRTPDSGKDSQQKGTPASKLASRTSSIVWNMPTMRRTPSGRTGASESEQLPVTTVVTPWSGEGVARPSQQSCAS